MMPDKKHLVTPEQLVAYLAAYPEDAKDTLLQLKEHPDSLEPGHLIPFLQKHPNAAPELLKAECEGGFRHLISWSFCLSVLIRQFPDMAESLRSLAKI